MNDVGICWTASPFTEKWTTSESVWIGLAGKNPHKHLMLNCASGTTYDLGDIQMDTPYIEEVEQTLRYIQDLIRKEQND